eukprot:126561_1
MEMVQQNNHQTPFLLTYDFFVADDKLSCKVFIANVLLVPGLPTIIVGVFVINPTNITNKFSRNARFIAIPDSIFNFCTYCHCSASIILLNSIDFFNLYFAIFSIF